MRRIESKFPAMPSYFQTPHKFLDSHLMMLRYAPEDGLQRANANGIVVGDHFMVFAPTCVVRRRWEPF